MGEFTEKYKAKQKTIRAFRAEPPFPKIIKIDICNICNYSCIFCPQAKQSMSEKAGCIDHELCIRLLHEGYEAGAREICLSSTGEPLINKHLPEYIRLAKKLGYSYIFLNTNGFLMDTEMASKLLINGIDSVKFSVNGGVETYAPIHGNDGYGRVIANIKAFDGLRKKMNQGCKLYVSYVTTKYTENEVEEVCNELRDYCDDIMVMKANNRGGIADEVDDELYNGNDDYSYQWPCSQIFNNAYITAEGYLVVCCQDFENNMVIADLNHMGLAEAWNCDAFVSFRKRFMNKEYRNLLCDNCLNNTHHAVDALNPEYAGYAHDMRRRKDVAERILKLKMRYEQNGD